jgi:hypothetical protein
VASARKAADVPEIRCSPAGHRPDLAGAPTSALRAQDRRCAKDPMRPNQPPPNVGSRGHPVGHVDAVAVGGQGDLASLVAVVCSALGLSCVTETSLVRGHVLAPELLPRWRMSPRGRRGWLYSIWQVQELAVQQHVCTPAIIAVVHGQAAPTQPMGRGIVHEVRGRVVTCQL